jgi:hypothetical protein
MSLLRWTLVAIGITASSSLARADQLDVVAEPASVAHDVADGDAFTPGIARSVGSGRALTVGAVTYNGAAKQTTLDMTGEVHIWGPVRLVLQVSNVFETARPGIGAAVQFLDERRHGVSSSAYLSYKAEGFSEPEGEIEALVSFGKRLGPVHGTVNLAYGQDPEGNERDGEAALGIHVEPIRGLFTGVIGRYRDALGSNGDKATGIVRDVLAGVSATYLIGKVGVTLTGGLGGFKLNTASSMDFGPTGTASVGAVF